MTSPLSLLSVFISANILVARPVPFEPCHKVTLATTDTIYIKPDKASLDKFAAICIEQGQIDFLELIYASKKELSTHEEWGNTQVHWTPYSGTDKRQFNAGHYLSLLKYSKMKSVHSV